jgi:PAS domain S-box-containing protein
MKKRTLLLTGIIALALFAISATLLLIRTKTPLTLKAQFSTAEQEQLDALVRTARPIRIGHIPDTPPIDSHDGMSGRQGLTWDYVKLLEQKLGLHFVQAECSNWEAGLRDNTIDLVGSAQRTADREIAFDFSKPYGEIQTFILTHKNNRKHLTLDSLYAKRLIVVNDSAIHKELQRRQKTNAAQYGFILVPVSDIPTGMKHLADHAADAMVANGASVRYFMPALGSNLRIASKTDFTWSLSFASSTNSPLPTALINTALDMITKHDLRAMKKKWSTQLNTVELDRMLLLKISGSILLLTMLGIGAAVLWNRSLRKQITNQVHELGRVRQSHAQATQALSESEERFRGLVESSNDVIWEIDRYGCYTYVSPRIQAVLGYTPQELQGKSITSLMDPPDAAKKMEQLRRHNTNGIIDGEIATYRHKDGSKLILESSGMAYVDNTGQLAGYRGVSRNINQRVSNENALRNSEERFRNLVETTTDWIWEVNTDGCYTYLSPRSSELLGYHPEELQGKHFTALMPDKAATKLRMEFFKLCEAGQPIHGLITTNTHRSKQAVVLETSAVPFYDKEWKIQGYRGISRDITTRTAVERQLEFERSLFRSFMEHAPDLIFFKDATGRFIEVNTAMSKELRQPVDKIIGHTDFDFLPDEQARQTFADEASVMQTHQPVQKEEKVTRPDGDQWYFTTKVPRYDETGQVVGTFGTSWNITHRKQAEEQLRQLRTLLSNTIDSMPSILVGVDAAGRVIQWNRQAEAASGLQAHEALGRHLRNAFPELAKEMGKVERALQERKPQREERIQTQKDNHTRYHDVTVFPLEGNTEGAVIRVDDVTDRVIIEDSIRNIVEGVAVVGRRFFSSMVNQLSKTLGAEFTFISEFSDESRSRMRTLAVSNNGQLNANFDYEVEATPFSAVLSRNQCTHLPNVREQFPTTELLQTHGIESFIGIPLTDSEKKIQGIMVAMYREPIEDIDFATSIMQVFAGRTAAELERLQATKELIDLRNLLGNIINSMPSILIGVDAEGRVMQWNTEAERISGITSSRAHGQSLNQVLSNLSPELNQRMTDLLPKGAKHHERIHCQLNSHERIIDITVYPITTDGSDGAVIRLDDVTDRVRIEERMVQSEKMMSVGGLAAGMAHEINNPLAGILQNMQVIRNRIMLDTKLNCDAAEEAGITMETLRAYMEKRNLVKMLDSTTEAGLRAAKIVDNMLSFSRKDEAHFEPHSLEEIIERSIELASNDYNLKKRFDFRHIEIERDYEPLEPIPCERSQIQQVLLNLLSNSAQAMAECSEEITAPKIRIRIRNEVDMALIEIEDNGPGMDAETRKRAFEPFFTTKEVGHGTGLGLSVSFFIITENHGGTMHLDTAPGRGACFSLRLPYKHRTELWGLRL